MFSDGAVESERTSGPGDDIGKYDPQQAAGKGDGQSLGHELQKNVAFAGPQRLLNSDLAGALGHRDQHDVHQPNPTDSQRESANERQKHLKSQGDDLDGIHLLHGVEYEDRAMIGGIETVHPGDYGANIVLDLFVLHALVVNPYTVEVTRVLKVSHGAKGDVDDAVDIAVTFLHLGFENTDHLKTQAVDTYAVTEGKLPGEQFRFGLRADYSHAGPLQFVQVVEQPARLNF